jgi:hypothetical protein
MWIWFTLLNPAQIILNHLLTQLDFLKMCSQISNLLLQLSVLFGSIEKLTLERATRFARAGIKYCSKNDDQVCA